SSEMTQSMYHRSLAGQQQSKAGDQWSFFQAKRIRGTNMDMTGEMLQSFTTPPAFDLDRLAAQCRALSAALEKSGNDAAGARERVGERRRELASFGRGDRGQSAGKCDPGGDPNRGHPVRRPALQPGSEVQPPGRRGVRGAGSP